MFLCMISIHGRWTWPNIEKRQPKFYILEVRYEMFTVNMQEFIMDITCIYIIYAGYKRSSTFSNIGNQTCNRFLKTSQILL